MSLSDPAPQTALPRIAHRNLPLLLLKAREVLLARFRPILSHFGLTEQQWRVMRVLSEQHEMEPRQICDAIQILSPSLAGVLARMEELGLVERNRMPGDQRRVRVRLTPRSEDIVVRIAPLIEAQYALVEERLGKPLIDEVYQLLDRLLRHDLESIPTVALPPAPASPARAGDADAPADTPASKRTAGSRAATMKNRMA